jgi:hypothetical protein
VHCSSLVKAAPVDVTSVRQPSSWHFLAFAELPPPAVAVASPAVTAIAAQAKVAIVRKMRRFRCMSCSFSVGLR